MRIVFIKQAFLLLNIVLFADADVEGTKPGNSSNDRNGLSNQTLYNYLQASETNKYVNHEIFINANGNFELTLEKAMYKEKHCDNPSRTAWTSTKNGIIAGNTVLYDDLTSFDLIGRMRISPSSDLHSINVDFSVSDYSNGHQFRFTDDQFICYDGKSSSQSTLEVTAICVRAHNLVRGKEGYIVSCFVIGGVVLTSDAYDINTINILNDIMVLAIDVGCYRATSTGIQVMEGDDTKLNSTLDVMVKSARKDVCGSATMIASNLFLILITFYLLVKMNYY